MKIERERSPIQAVVDPMKDPTHQGQLDEMDYSQSGASSLQSSPSSFASQDFSAGLSAPSSSNQNVPSVQEGQLFSAECGAASQYLQFYNQFESVTQNASANGSNFMESSSQLEGGISKLQQDLSLVRISGEGCDSSLQSLYLERLQELVPWVPKDEELPKLQLVQAVIDYIHLLQDQLEAGGCQNSHNPADSSEIPYGLSEMNVASGSPFRETMSSSNTHLHSNGVDGQNSCHHSSSSSLSPSPSSSLPTPTAGQSHLFHDLEQKQLANELHQLRGVQRNTSEKMSTQRQMVDKFINQHEIIDDLRHMRTKNPVCGRQHMVTNLQGEGGSGEGAATPCSLARHIAVSATDADGSNMPSSDVSTLHGFLQHQNASCQDATNSIFPFPAPPSPQTIKAARKRKQQLRKLQELHGQQGEAFHGAASSNCAF